MKLLTLSEIQAMQLDLMKKAHQFFCDKNIKYYLIAGSALGAVRHGGFIPWDDDIDIGMFREDYERFINLSDQLVENSDYEICNFKNAKNCDNVLTRIYFKNTYIEDDSIKSTCLDKRMYIDVFPLDNVPDESEERSEYEKNIKALKRRIELTDARLYTKSAIKVIAKKAVSLVLKPVRQKNLQKLDRLMQQYRSENTEHVCSLCSQYSFAKQVMKKSVYGNPVLMKFEDSEFYVPENITAYLTTLYGKDYGSVPPPEKRRKGHNMYTV